MLLRTIYLFCCCALLLACQQQPEPEQELLRVGQRQLTLKQFERELALNSPGLQKRSEEDQLALKLQMVSRLIEREMIFAEAERSDIRVSPDELDEALAELRGNYTVEEYQQILADAGQTEQSWKSGLKLRLITMKVSNALIGKDQQVSEKEAEEYYLSNREEFRRPAELRARQMLFASLDEAEKVLKQLKAGGDFAELAKEHSLSPDRENGGNLGYFSKGQLPPEFDKVLFNLSAGQLSEPVQSPYGYHLFLVERRRRAGIRPFAAIKNEIITKLSQQREEQAFHNWLEGLRNNTEIFVDWDLLRIDPAAKSLKSD